MDASPGKASRSRFRVRRCGVFDLTYEDTTASFTLRIYSLFDWVRAICEKLPYVKRQLTDTIKLAPAEFMVYMVTAVWQGIYPAINLYWLSILFDMLCNSFINGPPPPYMYKFLVIFRVSCVMVNVAAGRMNARSLEILAMRFRAHFIPQLICASLRVDLLSTQDLYNTFPITGRFESEFPGGPFLRQLGHFVQYTLGLTSQLLVLLHAISCKRSPDREVLSCFCVAYGLVWWLAPKNDIGCSAYIYWPNNTHFQRMKALFGLALSAQYRTNLVLDGLTSSVETEYMESAKLLGNVDVLDPTIWCTELKRDWRWNFLVGITLDLPMTVYALMPSTYLSPSSIASIVLLQHATKSLSFSTVQYTEETPSLLDICSNAKRLYDAVNYQCTMPQGTEPFPHPTDGFHDAGMKISFRHVSLRYPGSDRDALHNISFDIQPGELVLVVGTNGSGKSSMLKLLARLLDPTAGAILVNDLPLVRYDMHQLRAAMTFQSQLPAVYPVTVRENIAFGLPSTFDVKQEHIEEAARMSDCSGWISRLSDGYNTRLQPSFDINNGWMDGIYGYPSKALEEELARHNGRLVSISDGEKQRLATARTVMRINNRTTRLVVVDEATSSLDPVAERDILSEFRRVRTGKTLIFVTHRFYHLAREADRILCMRDGSIVESGTHTELLCISGHYAALYNAQAE